MTRVRRLFLGLATTGSCPCAGSNVPLRHGGAGCRPVKEHIALVGYVRPAHGHHIGPDRFPDLAAQTSGRPIRLAASSRPLEAYNAARPWFCTRQCWPFSLTFLPSPRDAHTATHAPSG